MMQKINATIPVVRDAAQCRHDFFESGVVVFFNALMDGNQGIDNDVNDIMLTNEIDHFLDRDRKGDETRRVLDSDNQLRFLSGTNDDLIGDLTLRDAMKLQDSCELSFQFVQR